MKPLFDAGARAAAASAFAGRNRVALGQACRRLAAGGCIGIVPEGRTSSRARAGPLRKGIARMAPGAARNGLAPGRVIVPVGVKLDRRELLTSDALPRRERGVLFARLCARFEGLAERFGVSSPHGPPPAGVPARRHARLAPGLTRWSAWPPGPAPSAETTVGQRRIFVAAIVPHRCAARRTAQNR